MALNNAINSPVVGGIATLTSNAVLLGNAANPITATAAFTANGQLLIGNGSSAPAVATLIQGSGITITNGAGTITIAADSTGGLTWTSGVTTGALAAGTGSFVTAGSQQTLTLPTGSSTVGDTIAVANAGSFATAWKIAQNASQAIKIGNTTTSTGTGGSLTSSAAGDCVEIVCYDATTNAEKWMVVPGYVGNLTVA